MQMEYPRQGGWWRTCWLPLTPADQTALQLVDFSWETWRKMPSNRRARTSTTSLTRNPVDQGDMVKGDKALWTLAASNLLENALKYGEGRITVHAEVKGDKRYFRWRMKVKASRPKTKRWPWRRCSHGKKNQALDWTPPAVKQPHCTGLRWHESLTPELVVRIVGPCRI